MPISVFLSTVSDEFLAYRKQLNGDLTRHNVAVKVQEDFKDLGGDTLESSIRTSPIATPWFTWSAT